jgi:hypothetical protein
VAPTTAILIVRQFGCKGNHAGQFRQSHLKQILNFEQTVINETIKAFQEKTAADDRNGFRVRICCGAAVSRLTRR